MSDSRLPPRTFDLTPRAFRPTRTFTHRRELREAVEALHLSHQFRSAMDLIFNVLAKEPDDEEALRLAMVVAGASRTQQVQSPEPLSPQYLNDPRLDPIVAVCSQCQTTAWIPKNTLIAFLRPDAAMQVMNPVGLQCYDCGFVICRKCQEKRQVNFETQLIERSCPNCRGTDVRPTVYPTGRRPIQLPHGSSQASRVLILREGPIPPEGEYIQELLERRLPDALRGDVRITVWPLENWPQHVESFVQFLVMQIQEGDPSVGEITDLAEIRDDTGARVLVVTLSANDA